MFVLLIIVVAAILFIGGFRLLGELSLLVIAMCAVMVVMSVIGTLFGERVLFVVMIACLCLLAFH